MRKSYESCLLLSAQFKVHQAPGLCKLLPLSLAGLALVGTNNLSGARQTLERSDGITLAGFTPVGLSKIVDIPIQRHTYFWNVDFVKDLGKVDTKLRKVSHGYIEGYKTPNPGKLLV